MAARVRGRPGLLKEDADEERSLWNEIRKESKRVDTLMTEHNSKWARMREIVATLDQQSAVEDETSGELEEELMALSREQIKLTENIQQSLEGSSDGDVNSLLGQINLLAALRASSEADILSLPPSRSSTSLSKGGRNTKRKADTASIISQEDRDSIAADSSAAASPKVQIPAASRLKSTTGLSRAGSVPTARESSVKIEEGTESGVESIKDTKPRFAVGSEVLYKKKASQKDKDGSEGEGILCIIHSIIGEGKQRRYEIRDADPDTTDLPYRASLAQMTPIPFTGSGLPEISPKKGVLALYPQTTTFYKAEVVSPKRAGGSDGATPEGYVRLRFEGEEEQEKELDVERRYVLTDWIGR